MATGFMPHFMALCLLTASTAWAADVALIGVIGAKAAVLSVDGGEPKTVKVGDKWHGVGVVSVEKDRATVDIDGRRRVLLLGQHQRSVASASSRESVTLAADARGHFVADGAVNGVPMRFLVDTGATSIALPASEAQRLGIDYRKGERGLVQTANGNVQVYRVKLDSVKVGSIELQSVEAVVTERGLSIPLLGMSFLNRVEMKRDGEAMTLIRRF
jgi:aspartyl protease family protein